MNVATRGVTVGTAHVNLVIQLGEEGLGIHGGATRAHEARAAGGGGGHLQGLGRSAAVLGLRRVHLHEVGAKAESHAGGTGDEVGILLGGHGLAARVDPQHDDEAVGMGLGDELARLGHHGGLVLGAEVDRVAEAHDVHAGLLHGQHGVQIVQLRGVGILLLGADEVGLGVHLDEVVDLRIVGRVLGHQPALAGEHAADALGTNLEQVLRVEVSDIDALAVEVLVQVLDLLIAGEQHETAGLARGLQVVGDVLVTGLGHDVGGNAHLFPGDLRHGFPPRESLESLQ